MKELTTLVILACLGVAGTGIYFLGVETGNQETAEKIAAAEKEADHWVWIGEVKR